MILVRQKSTIPRKMETITTTTITTDVEAIAPLKEGHVTFLSSTRTSLRNCFTFAASSFTLSIDYLQNNGRPGGIRTPSIRIWSPALYPLELLACSVLFSLPVDCMRAAEFAVLLQFQPVLHGSLVLGGGVVPLLATGTRQSNDISHKTCFQWSPRPGLNW